MIEAAEEHAVWRKVFAAEAASANITLFLVRATACLTRRQLTNPQFPYSESQVCDILRPLCGDNALDELARWMSRAQPRDFRQVETREAHITISCHSPAQLGLVPESKEPK